jgi:hypothetical protein
VGEGSEILLNMQTVLPVITFIKQNEITLIFTVADIVTSGIAVGLHDASRH